MRTILKDPTGFAPNQEDFERLYGFCFEYVSFFKEHTGFTRNETGIERPTWN
jgi:hypothetical protein